jgi:hypothetical protein
MLGDQTLTPGGPAIEAQGTTYSLASSASAIVINDHTTPLSATPTIATLIAGKTLIPGSAVVNHGTTYSLAPSGNAVVVDGTTKLLATTKVTSTITPISILGTISIGEGGIFTISGKTYTIPTSAASSGNSGSVYGSVTETLVVGADGETFTLSAAHTRNSGIGDAVASGLQISTPTSTASRSLDGSRVLGSGVATTTTSPGRSGTETQTGDSGAGTRTGTTSVATASTAGVEKLAHRGIWDVVGAAVVGGLIVF